MDYVKPEEVVRQMLAAGQAKVALPPKDLLLRGMLSGALLGFATSLAFTATAQTGSPLAGALVFPVGFVMIVLLGLELVTGSFSVVMLAGATGRAAWPRVAANLAWVFAGNLLGSLLYAGLLGLVLTSCGSEAPAGIATKLAAAAAAKTTGYAAHGAAGLATAFVKGVLCNWMVCLGAVMAFTARATAGKIIAMWLPILTFFAQGFEHSVVNMFLIPAGMLLGAKVSLADWWLWNQIPVTLGNLAGGFLFSGLFLYWTYGRATQTSEPPAARSVGGALADEDPAGA